MENIHPLYHNPFGVAFQWKRCTAKEVSKVQLVFRDTGLLFSHDELSQFLIQINGTLKEVKLCSNCAEDGQCRAIILETPLKQLSFAISLKELKALSELVEGALFQLGLNKMLRQL
ncbi:MAG: hypothetical protein AAGB24_06420 [Bacteroidota bacterium]